MKSEDDPALREAIDLAGGPEVLDPLAKALADLRRPRELTRDEWLRAYEVIQEHNIRVGGSIPSGPSR